MSTEVGKKVLLLEARSIQEMAKRVGVNFKTAVDLMCASKHPIILIGMGKPAFIADKISASLASTGTLSFTLHPADALHGDIGRIKKNSVVLLFSNSGETEELVRLIPLLKELRCKLIAITGNLKSYVAKFSDTVLDTSVISEAKPLDVAPTASTTCMLAMGDALTMAIVTKKGFRKEDFAMLHPGGFLGRQLRMTVGDVMRSGVNHPRVLAETTIKAVLIKITKARAGSATVVDSKGRCIGIFTDGDLRRYVEEKGAHLDEKVSLVMTKNPTTVSIHALVSEVLHIFKRRKVDEIPVVDARLRAVGLLDIQDLLSKGF